LHQSAVLANDGSLAVVPPLERMANFYRKYNRVVLDNIAIAKEKERLQLENAQLQDLIQQYLNGTQLNNDVLADDNPLFVVNGRFVSFVLVLFDAIITYFFSFMLQS
jgi:hypothetical protein